MESNRRNFIKFVVTGSVAAGCPVDLSLLAAPAPAPAVDGEHNEICHQVRDGHLFSRPPASARHDIVVVGGGMSGLSCAWFLRGQDFLLLEKEEHWGGNAYLEEYAGQAFATGTAYTSKSESGVIQLCRELGIEPLPIACPDGLILNREFIPHAWHDGLDHLPYPQSVRDSFRKFKHEMLKVNLMKRAGELDALPLTDLLKDYAPELKAWWDTYGPSNWGATAADTSALVGLGDFQDFAGDDPDDRVTFPGGLGAISRKLAERLHASHSDRMLAGATTVAVEQGKSDVTVTYVHEGQVKAVTAKAVIMATPKFITRRLVAGLPKAQQDAMHRMRYAPYPVVNLIFDKPVFNGGYDTWCPGNTFTDVIVADWVVRNQPGYHQENNILTFYTPLREAERARLLTEDGARELAASVLHDWQKLLPGSNADPLEVHIYRRGHPMFMATPGTYTKVIPAARHPMERIFFANTDSSGPVSTTSGAITASHRAIGEMKRMLAGKP
ncbi:MAG TPA: FAD-dependent oxidoreductase [Bryobacteraceae bacterium]|nr:FAD-dependent oxidoreductase [Bryobacteraceae bacterium]